MSYTSKRYKEGLDGSKPGWEVLDDKEGHAAQEAGYRDHLANEDLAYKLAQQADRNSSSSKYDPDPPTPLSLVQRVIWVVVGLVFATPSVLLGLTAYRIVRDGGWSPLFLSTAICAIILGLISRFFIKSALNPKF